jgi:protein involved in polysaccharide export with SLBB domain
MNDTDHVMPLRAQTKMKTKLITVAFSRMGTPAVCLLLVIMGLPGSITQASLAQQSNSVARDSQNNCQQILIMGAVRRAVRVDANRKIRLTEVLAMAGGPTHGAGKTVRIVHSCDKLTGGVDEYNLVDALRGRESGNPCVVPGDVVVVTSADLVAVIGNVRKTEVVFSEIVFVDGMTMMRAIELAGGIRQSSDLVMVRIHRSSKGVLTRDPITVSLKAIKKWSIDDVPLQPWDVVEVSDKLGHFRLLKPGHPFWDPPLIPRKEKSVS